MAPRNHADCVERYCDAVLSGEIIAGHCVQLAVERHLDDLEHAHERGLQFDSEIAEKALRFVETVCTHQKAEWAGQPFLLSPNQQFILWNLTGWRRENGCRRFERAYITAGRKWGKSLFASAIMKLLTLYDTPIEPGAEVYSRQRTDRRHRPHQCQRQIEVSTLNQMRGHFRSLLARFGLTPKSKRGRASSEALDAL